MPFAQGMSEALYGGFEQSFKVLPGTVNAVKTPVISPQFKPAVARFKSEALSGSPDPRSVIDGKIGVDFTTEVEFSKESATMWLKGLCGTPEVQGTAGFFDHYFTLKSMLSMFFEQRHSDISQNFLWKGCYVGEGQFQFESEGLCKATFSGMGAIQVNEGSSTAINGAIQDKMGEDPINYLFGVLKEGGVALGYVQSLSFRVNRGVDKRGHMDGTNEIGVIFSQVAEITGNIKASFQDKDLLDKALNSTELSLELTVYQSGHGIQVLFPTVKLKPTAPITNGTGLADLDFEFDAYARGTASDIAAEVVSKAFTTVGGLNTLTLVIATDGATDQTVTFETADDDIDEIITEINTETTLCTASKENGRIVIKSDTKGAASSIRIQPSSTAAAALGFDTVLHNGYSAKAVRFRVSNASATVQ